MFDMQRDDGVSDAEYVAGLHRRVVQLEYALATRDQELAWLHEMVEHYRIIADHTCHWEHWIGPDGRLRYVSPACESITGYPPDAFLADPLLLERILHPEDSPQAMQQMRQALERAERAALDFRIITRDGQVRWIGYACQPVYAADGRWLGQRASQRDITSQKQAEEAYRLLFENSVQGLTIHQDGQTVVANPAAERITGYTPDELRAMTPAEAAAVIHPEDRALVVQRGKDRIAGKDIPPHYTFRIIRKDGAVRWVEAHATQIEYQGRPAAQMTYIDMTERVQAEADYRTLVEDSLQGLSIYQDGHTVLANPAAERITGYTQAELRAMSPEATNAIIHPEDLTRLLQRANDRLAGKDVSPRSTFRIIRKDGAMRWLELFAAAITYQGRPAVQMTYLDMTERVQAEEAYRALVEHSLQGLGIYQDGRIVAANPAITAILGYTPDELRAMAPEDFNRLTHPEDRAMVVQRAADRLAGKDMPPRLIYRIIRKDGAVRWIEHFAKTIIYQERPAVQIVMLDITERVQAEEAYHTLVEHSLQGLAIYQEGQMVVANPTVARILGYTQAELRAMSPEATNAIIHPEDRAQVVQRAADRLAGKEVSSSSTFRIIRKDGVVRWIEHFATPIQYRARPALQVAMLDITERIEAEEAYRALVENSLQGFAIRQDGHAVFCNPAAERITGYTLAELQAQSPDEASATIHPDDRAMVIQRANDRMAGKAVPSHYTFRIIRKDGAVRWIESYAVPITYRGRLAAQISYIDITEQVEAEARLRLQERALAAVSTGIVIADAQQRDQPIIYCNAAFERITGYRAAEVQGRNCRFLQGRERHQDALDIVRQAIRRGEACSVVLRNYRKDGTLFWNELGLTPMHDEQGRLTHFIGSMNDISERVQAAEALYASEEKFRGFFEQSNDGLVLVDDQGTIIDWSQGATQIFGLPRADVLGRPRWDVIYQVVPPDLRSPELYEQMRTMTLAFLQTDLQTEGRYPEPEDAYFVRTIQRPDGAQRIIAARVFPIQANGRTFAGSIVQDITDLKQTETELRTSLERLKQRNHEALLLNQMGHLLQSCTGVAEAYKVIGFIANKLFAGDVGALYMRPHPQTHDPQATDPSSPDHPPAGSFVAVAHWGSAAPVPALLGDEDCHALQQRQPYLVAATHVGTWCPHVRQAPAPPFASLCVPLQSQGEVLGLLHLRGNGPASQEASRRWQRLAETVAGQIALALSNLLLRERLQQQVIRDPLTGLFNRRYLDETLRRELQRAADQSRPLGIIMADIDHFKRFNDTYGHDAGDVLLRAVGALLQARTRRGDIACRYGGEEFTLVLPGATLEQTRLRAEEIRAAVGALQIDYARYQIPPVTISLGVAASPEHGASDDTLIQAADSALYAAKTMGRDRVWCALARE